MTGEDARARLLRAAGPVFAEKGYHAATVREICTAAGVNVASVNYYFGDKEALYVETVKLARQLRAEQFPMPEWSGETTPEERLRGFITTMVFRIVAAEEASWNTQLMLREVVQPTGACRALVEEYFRPQFNLLLGILREMLDDTTPDHICRKIGFSIMGQCVYYRIAEGVVAILTPETERHEQFQPEQIAEHIADMCLAALGATSPLGQGRSAAPRPPSVVEEES